MQKFLKWWRAPKSTEAELKDEVSELSKENNYFRRKVSDLEEESENLSKTIKLLEVDKEVLTRERDMLALVIERDRQRVIQEAKIGEKE